MNITTLPVYGLNTSESVESCNYTGRVYGTVTDQNGEPLENVRVTLNLMIFPLPWFYRTKTDSNGFYEFNHVLYGLYDILFVKNLIWKESYIFILDNDHPEVLINCTLKIGFNSATLESQDLEHYSNQQQFSQGSQSL
jgi:hypothetical protein